MSETGKGCGTGCLVMLVAFILGIVAFIYLPPILPHIQLAAEPLTKTPLFGNVYLTNTMVAMLLVDIIVLLLAFAVSRAVKKSLTGGYLVPKGISGAVEALLEALHNLTESTAGKWTPKIFPWFAAITMFVLVANWIELIPGVDSIGLLHESEHGYPAKELTSNVFYIYKPETAPAEGEHAADEHSGSLYHIYPFVRVLATDLNFTIGLALIVMVMVQVYGVMSHGGGYFSKFLPLNKIFPPAKVSKNPLSVIDVGIGVLELISEFSKILSFSFRLFGNIFAGSVLLFVIGSLVSVIGQWLFLGLEFFVGLIQAIVFGMLAMVFMSQATAGHGEHSEEGAH